MENFEFMSILHKYAKIGVTALSAATPKDDGSTAASWGYEIENSGDKAVIYWTNTDQNDGVYIAVIIQFGHGTGTGAYIPPVDYINPAMKPVFDQIAEAVWREVTRL